MRRNRSPRIQMLLNEAYNYKKRNPGEEIGFLSRLDRVLAIDPRQPVALKEQGYALIRLHRYEEAAQIFGRLAPLVNDATIYLQLGYLYDALDRKADAYKAFQNASRYAKTASQRQRASHSLAVLRPVVTGEVVAHSSSSTTKRTVEVVEAPLEGEEDNGLPPVDPTLPLIERRLNEAYNFHKRYPGDDLGYIAQLDRVLKEDENNTIALNAKGFAQIRLRKIKDALGTFTLLTTLDKNNYEVWMQEGYLLDRIGRKLEAIDAFGQALKLARTAEERDEANRGILVAKNLMVGRYVDPLDPDILAELNATRIPVPVPTDTTTTETTTTTVEASGDTPIERALNEAFDFHRLNPGDDLGYSVRLERALSIDPNSTMALLEEGFTYIRLNRTTDATNVFSKLADLVKTDATVWLQLGYLYDAQGRKADAATAFQNALDNAASNDVRDKATRSLQVLRGVATSTTTTVIESPAPYTGSNLSPLQLALNDAFSFHRTYPGDETGYLTRLDRVLGIDPGATMALQEKGFVYTRLDRVNDALSIFDKLTTLDRTNYSVFMQYGYLLDRVGRKADAVAAFEQALRLATNGEQRDRANQGILVAKNLAVGNYVAPATTVVATGQTPLEQTLNEAFNFHKAYPGDDLGYLTRLERVLQIDPNATMPLQEQGFTLIRLGRTRDATDVFARLSPLMKSSSIYLQLGYLYDSQGRKAEAGDAFQHALQYATTYEERDKANRALLVLQNAVPGVSTVSTTTVVTSGNGVSAIEQSLNEAFNFHKAYPGDDLGYVTRLESSLRIDPNSTMALQEQGYTLIRLGRPAEAATVFARLANLLKTDANIWLQLGYLDDSLGRKGEAYNAFRNALQYATTADVKDKASNALLVLRNIVPGGTVTGNPVYISDDGGITSTSELWNDAVAYHRIYPLDDRGYLIRLEKLLAADPNDAEAAREEGYALARINRNADAIPYLERYVGVTPNDGRAWLQLAELYELQGRKRAAYDAYSQAERFSLDNTSRDKARKGKKAFAPFAGSKDAVSSLPPAPLPSVSSLPSSSEGTVTRRTTARRTETTVTPSGEVTSTERRSTTTTRTVATTVPSPAPSGTGVSGVGSPSHDTTALADAYRYREQNPDDREGFLTHIDTLLATDPNNIPALQERAYTLIYLKRIDEAIATLEKLSRLEPDNPEFHLQLGYLYDGQKRKQAGYREFKAAVATSPAAIANAKTDEDYTRLKKVEANSKIAYAVERPYAYREGEYGWFFDAYGGALWTEGTSFSNAQMRLGKDWKQGQVYALWTTDVLPSFLDTRTPNKNKQRAGFGIQYSPNTKVGSGQLFLQVLPFGTGKTDIRGGYAHSIETPTNFTYAELIGSTLFESIFGYIRSQREFQVSGDAAEGSYLYLLGDAFGQTHPSYSAFELGGGIEYRRRKEQSVTVRLEGVRIFRNGSKDSWAARLMGGTNVRF